MIIALTETLRLGLKYTVCPGKVFNEFGSNFCKKSVEMISNIFTFNEVLRYLYWAQFYQTLSVDSSFNLAIIDNISSFQIVSNFTYLKISYFRKR